MPSESKAPIDKRCDQDSDTLRGQVMEIAPRISVNKRVRFGKPVITGTRIPVDLILGKLAGGMTYDEVIAEYEITREDILAVLDYKVRVRRRQQGGS